MNATTPHRPLLFGLEGSRDYAARLGTRLGLSLTPHEEREFEDGEHKARPLVEVDGSDAVVVHALYSDRLRSVNDRLCRLLFFSAALKDGGARQVTAVVPYLCYARKDRRTKPQDPVTSRYVARLLESSGIDRVLTLEVHNVAAFENAFRIPTRHLESADLFAAHFAPLLHGEPAIAVSPDAGGAKRAEQFRLALERASGTHVGSAYMEKHRSAGVVTGNLLAGEVRGATAIIVDDLISTGGTLRRAAHACREAGARRIYAAAAHGLFMTGAEEVLADPVFERFVIADTVEPFRLDPDLAKRRLSILDSTALFAAALAPGMGLTCVNEASAPLRDATGAFRHE